MSAKLDRDQPIHFHYGIAHKDLQHLLPPEDDFSAAASPFSDIMLLLDQNERTLKQISQTRSKLSFFIKDLKRLIS